MKEKVVLCVVLLVLIADRGLGINEEAAKKFLLPGNLVPRHYNIHLITKIDKFKLEDESSLTFDGEVTIFMDTVKDNVTDIVLNLGEFTTIRDTILYRAGSKPVSLGKGSYHKRNEKVTFPLPFALAKDESLRFDINFTAGHRDYGFLHDFYYGKNNTKRWFVYTDLQPGMARYVFPCFDEPKYKATYHASVSVASGLVSDGYHALSNTAVSWKQELGNSTIIHFERTRIPMSTYLFSVIVSDYVSTKPRYFNDSEPGLKRVELKTWGKAEDVESYGEFPQAAAFALFNIYTEDFGIGYDFGKMDQVAVQGYPGGMENWGLIIYGDYLLGTDYNDILTLIAHEIAHQWFGNLVTLHWWADVWLNEGFATYFEYFGADKLNYEGINGKFWNFPYQFIIDVVQFMGMRSDVPEGYNHPLTVEVYDPNEYCEYFNRYSYGKGAAIIYMWRNIYGEKAFLKVLGHYLRTFQGGVVTPEGLLSCFDRYAKESESDLEGMKPSEIFRNWHKKAGVPIVSVSKMKDNPSTYVLSQDVFRLAKLSPVEEPEWTIPISYSTSDNYNFNSTKAEVWLTPGKKQIIKLPKPVKWIVVNNQESGYYRVNYNLENWKELFRVLNESADEIHEINRAQIMDDSHEIARSTAFDYLPYEMVLNMMLYLRSEPSYFPWKSAFNKLEFLKTQLNKNDLVYPLFRMFVLDLLTNRVESSWLAQQECRMDNEHKLEKTVLFWACEMGHPSCSLQRKWILNSPEERKKICPDSVDVTYCAFIRSNSNNMTWDEVWTDYETAKNSHLRRSLIRGLGCSKNEFILRRLLEKSIDDSAGFSRTERSEMVSAVLKGNAENVNTLLTFMEDNLHQLKTPLVRRYLEWDIFVKIAEKLSSHGEISRMRKLISALGELTKMEAVSGKILQKATGIMSANNDWQQIRSTSVSDWLISRYSGENVN